MRRVALLAIQIVLIIHRASGFVGSACAKPKKQAITPPKTSGSFIVEGRGQSEPQPPQVLLSASSPTSSSSASAAAGDGNTMATPLSDLELKSENICFGGRLLRYVHQSKSTKTPMTFTVFLPPQASEDASVPVLYYLSGLTCTDENFIQKAGAQRTAAQRGIALVAPDTSPRGAGTAGEDDSWDFGTAAGFYVDATEAGWKDHYRMYEYVTKELPEIIAANFKVDTGRASVFGHSMGGHGALVVAFRNPTKYRSVSAFSAICNPVECAWGKKAFTGYLGGDEASWREYDATELMRRDGPFPSLGKILLDQGSADIFLKDGQLNPETLVKACEEKGQPSELRIQEGYDHSYFFISSFVEDHINMHADRLMEKSSEDSVVTVV